MILDSFRIDGKIALVTGSSAGLGAAIAVALAEAGATVVCHGNTRSADATCDRIRSVAPKRTVAALQGDLRDPATAVMLVGETLRRFQRLDILVNNAGMIRRSPAADYSLEDWEAVLQTNLSSVFRLSQLAGRKMIEQGNGKIVNIASLLAFQGGIWVPAYAAAKAGLAALTKSLANEWAGKNINVNAIAPGYMRTDNTVALQQDPTRNRQILERIPAGRWGEPGDLCGAALFLCSRASDYVHGHILVVDGGWMGR